MSQGWISIHRKLKESSFYKDSQAVHLWIHLLVSANHKEAQFVKGNKVYDVKRGQLLTGRKLLSADTGINESKLQRLLKVFEKCHMIEQQTNSVNRLISILNYDSYQAGEQQVNSKRTASEQQVNTNNNDNNKNNDNKAQPFSMPDDVYAKACNWFYDELLKAGKLKKSQNWRTKLWYDGFRLLIESDKININDFREVLDFYIKNISKEYCPHAYSPKSFREKWIKINDFMKRELQTPNTQTEPQMWIK